MVVVKSLNSYDHDCTTYLCHPTKCFTPGEGLDPKTTNPWVGHQSMKRPCTSALSKYDSINQNLSNLTFQNLGCIIQNLAESKGRWSRKTENALYKCHCPMLVPQHITKQPIEKTELSLLFTWGVYLLRGNTTLAEF